VLVATSVLINGILTNVFSMEMGLCQGDPYRLPSWSS